MAEKKEKKVNRRTQVKDLPKGEKALTKEEQKKIKGGPTGGIIGDPIGGLK